MKTEFGAFFFLLSVVLALARALPHAAQTGEIDTVPLSVGCLRSAVIARPFSDLDLPFCLRGHSDDIVDGERYTRQEHRSERSVAKYLALKEERRKRHFSLSSPPLSLPSLTLPLPSLSPSLIMLS
jgi:hypothetical protein